MHGDFAGVFASSFVRLDHDGGANPEQAEGRGNQAEGAHNQWEENPAQIVGEGVKRDTQDHGTNVFGGGGLEEIGTTTGAVTHIVAHQVGYDSGVAGIVFRNAGFNFTNQVSANVSSFRVDTAAELG